MRPQMKRRLTQIAIAVAILPLVCMVILSPESLGWIGLLGMAVTANQVTLRRGPEWRGSIPVAASTRLYEGTLVFAVHDSGYGDDDTDSGANYLFGIACEDYDNSSGSAGDIDAECYIEGEFVLTGSSFTQATVGEKIYASDNYTVTVTSTSNVYVGHCTEYISATKIRVRIEPGKV
jgi:predicted RecA/RadA family phage recombinase